MSIRRTSSVIASTVAVLVITAAAPAQSAPQNRFETAKLVVRYHGRALTQAALQDLQDRGKALHVVYDAKSARAGAAHAFDTAAEEQAWAADNVRRTPKPARRLFSIKSAEATCFEPTSGSRLYDTADCGGNFLAVLRTKDIPHLSSFGAGGSATWNDRASSIVEEGTTVCALLVRLYQHSNYNAGATGWVQYYYGDTVPLYWNMGSGVSNEGSSLHSTCS